MKLDERVADDAPLQPKSAYIQVVGQNQEEILTTRVEEHFSQ